ncbi:helix-turn-helix domain-containing protein [Massilia sp. DWR3-1-1]|uniref:helix-turn-helix domain-containing protein n=1 Tax=Massilia sp. DWR3-1-1 TaxID=2804559 RepID=UPI003CF7E262
MASLARQLGTNTSTLSRAINDGLGVNFNELINRLRTDAVLAALQGDDERRPLLEIALAEGFNSKASFIRAFKLYTGQTPSAYRQGLAPPV